ncbi:hypothetical protein ACFFIX_20385 [Metabacillus herbersteinensis]|uniref:DUF3854 domain-containing protein n=1 Tax=Metabacillus herbersteinensis TaxID=283816 RepID=A0ABV6GJW3_9BACI
MNNQLRKTRIPEWYEFMRVACPICGKTGGCMQHKDGDAVACIRVESDRPFSKNSSLPSYLHMLKGEKKRKKINDEELPTYHGEEKKEDSVLNSVFQSMLDCLELKDSHYAHLTSSTRQLSEEQIHTRKYRSLSSQPWNVVKEIQTILGIDDFSGIPGFYLADGKYGKYWTINATDGILIPFRNHKNQIVGLQYRIDKPPNDVKIQERKQGLTAKVIEQPNIVQVSFEGDILSEQKLELDQPITIFSKDKEILGWIELKRGTRYFWLSSANKNKGTGSGNPSPVHVSVPLEKLKKWEAGTTLKAKTVWLGEGPLKGDISCDFVEKLYDPEEIEDIGTTFLSLPGVNPWRLALPILKEMEVGQVNICFDADAVNNPYVRQHLMDSAKKMKEEGYRANLIIWNGKDGIGLDNLFLNLTLPQIKKLF